MPADGLWVNGTLLPFAEKTANQDKFFIFTPPMEFSPGFRDKHAV